MYTNATISQLNQALEQINKEYNNNISFRDIKPVSAKRNLFTLKAKSGEKGSKFAASGRRTPSASWHVHGQFFDLLFSLDPSIYILSRGNKITVQAGNWIDSKEGSHANPVNSSALSIL